LHVDRLTSQPKEAVDVADDIGVDHQKRVDIWWQHAKSTIDPRRIPEVAPRSHKLETGGS